MLPQGIPSIPDFTSNFCIAPPPAAGALREGIPSIPGFPATRPFLCATSLGGCIATHVCQQLEMATPEASKPLLRWGFVLPSQLRQAGGGACSSTTLLARSHHLLSTPLLPPRPGLASLQPPLHPLLTHPTTPLLLQQRCAAGAHAHTYCSLMPPSLCPPARSGAVLLAPMLSLQAVASSSTNQVLQKIAHVLNMVVPGAAIVGGGGASCDAFILEVRPSPCALRFGLLCSVGVWPPSRRQSMHAGNGTSTWEKLLGCHVPAWLRCKGKRR